MARLHGSPRDVSMIAVHWLKPSFGLLASIQVTEAVRSTGVGFLLTQKAAEASVPTAGSFVLESWAVVFQSLLVLDISHFTVLVSVVDFLPFDVKLAQLLHVVHNLVPNFYALFCLVECILMSMNLTENGTVLKLKFSNDEYLPHSVGDAFLV